MERSNERYPPWLEPLITTDFYGDNGVCEQHNLYCTFFCKECTYEPLCESCWKDAEEHEGHKFLQTFKVSQKASVRKADIKEEVDVIDIQPYTINNHKVLLLKSKEGNGGYPNCVICQAKIKDEQYQFCSIYCKIVGERLMLGHSESETCEENEVECSTQNNSLRKKPRKRRPWRSPLF